jgi:hypothetical protein
LILRLPARDSPVADVLPAGGVDWRRPSPGREVAAVREPGDVADVSEDPRRPGRADAVDVHQVRPGGEDSFLELGIHSLQLRVEPFDVREFFRGHPAAHLPGRIVRPHAGQQRLVLSRRLLHRRPAGH